MEPAPLRERDRVLARAWCVGARLDVRGIGRADALALAPLTVRAGREGCAVLFRYGAVVLFGLEPTEETAYLETLAPLVADRFEEPESDDLELVVAPGQSERVDQKGALHVRELDLDRIQTIANVLAKSAVLSHYETRVGEVFEGVETLARKLQSGGRRGRAAEFLNQLGDVLLTQAQMVGRVEVTEKPEITWERPELDRLYERLSLDFELHERDLALSRKLEIVSRASETSLELLQAQRSLRVEWYIVALIAVEIAIILWEMGLHP